MRRWAEFVLHHRRLVMLFWLAVIVVGAGISSKVNDRLTVDFSLPGQTSGFGTGETFQIWNPQVLLDEPRIPADLKDIARYRLEERGLS